MTPDMGAEGDQQNPLASLLRMGICAMKGLGKGLGKGVFGYGGGQHGCHGGWWGQHGGHDMFKIKALKFCVAQLYKNDMLDADAFAALLVNSLPMLMIFIAEIPEK